MLSNQRPTFYSKQNQNRDSLKAIAKAHQDLTLSMEGPAGASENYVTSQQNNLIM